MKINAIKIEPRFIPEWNGNRELPPSEQMVITFSRIPGTSEKSNYKDFKVDPKGGIQLVYNDQSLIQAFVKNIDNFEIDIDGTERKIKNGIDLASATSSLLPELFTEIRNYLFPDDEGLNTGEQKA